MESAALLRATERDRITMKVKNANASSPSQRKNPLRSTKLTLWKWLLVMHLSVSSSKGISSVVLARWLGVTQPTAWKTGHATRKMMDPSQSDVSLLTGVAELDEMYVGENPRQQEGQKNKRSLKKVSKSYYDAY
jgi:hypothetical protein